MTAYEYDSSYDTLHLQRIRPLQYLKAYRPFFSFVLFNFYFISFNYIKLHIFIKGVASENQHMQHALLYTVQGPPTMTSKIAIQVTNYLGYKMQFTDSIIHCKNQKYTVKVR